MHYCVGGARLPTHIPPRFNLSPCLWCSKGEAKEIQSTNTTHTHAFPFSPNFNSFYIFRPRRLIINKIEVNSVFLCCTRQTYYVRRCAHKTVSQFVRPSVSHTYYIASKKTLPLRTSHFRHFIIPRSLGWHFPGTLVTVLSVDVVISYPEISTC